MNLTEARERLRALLAASEPLERRARAAEELRQKVPDASLFVGLAGCLVPEEPFEFMSGLAVLRRVTNAPGVVHVCSAADPRKADYLGVARYSGNISAELALAPTVLGDEGPPLTFWHEMAWHLAALVKLGGCDRLSCPASATVSWDVIAAVTDRSIPFELLDDVPRQITVGGDPNLDEGHLNWVREHQMAALEMRNRDTSRRFGLAFNLSYTWNHTSDPRVALAQVWAALEALFADQRDRPATIALAKRINGWVGMAVDEVRRLYDARCDALHGRWLDLEEIAEPLGSSVRLLRSSLKAAIERKRSPLPDWHA